MDFFIGLTAAVAFSTSAAAYCWMRLPDRAILDGDRYDVDEMLAAFGATGDWV